MVSAVGEGAVEVVELPLPAGHPTSHGRIGLRVKWQGQGDARRVAAAEAVVGSVHRGAEKLAEMRDYRQAIMLLDRHDWWGAFAGELGFVLAVEQMVGLAVPPRATVLRTVLAELTRCAGHLAFLAGAADTLPADTLPAGGPPTGALAGVAAVRELFEAATGNRVHPMFARVGGLADDVDDAWSGRLGAALPGLQEAAARAATLLTGPADRLAVLTARDVREMAVTGPAARAAGVDVDLRRDEPYAGYGDVFGAADVVTRSSGDAAARFAVMAEEVQVSCEVVRRCLDRLPAGPVRARMPRTLRVPEGAVFVWTESPQGASGYYLVSRGGPSPYRLKIRSSTFDTAAALSRALPGTGVADLPLALASLPMVAGDIDR